MIENTLWLPLDEAAKRFGYKQLGNFRRRLRRLREQGYVVDIGKVPPPYAAGDGGGEGKIVLYWPNHNTSLIRSDAPKELLNPKLGKRARKPKVE